MDSLDKISTSFVDGFHLSRPELLSKVVSALSESDIVVVTGRVGSGRAALVKLALQELAWQGETKFVTGNQIRDLEIQHELESNSPEPNQCVFMRNVDKALGLKDRKILFQILEQMKLGNLKTIIMTCTPESTTLLHERVLKLWKLEIGEVQVPELTKSELDEVAESVPSLSSLLKLDDQRWFLRTPYALRVCAQMPWTELTTPADDVTLRQMCLDYLSNDSQNLLANAHEAMEEWALVSWLRKKHAESDGLGLWVLACDFAPYHSVRRALQLWVNELLCTDRPLARHLFLLALREQDEKNTFYVDVTLSVLASDALEMILNETCNELFGERRLLIKKLVTTLKDSEKDLLVESADSFQIIPGSNAWVSVIKFLRTQNSLLSSYDYPWLSRLLDEWSLKATTVCCRPDGSVEAFALAWEILEGGRSERAENVLLRLGAIDSSRLQELLASSDRLRNRVWEDPVSRSYLRKAAPDAWDAIEQKRNGRWASFEREFEGPRVVWGNDRRETIYQRLNRRRQKTIQPDLEEIKSPDISPDEKRKASFTWVRLALSTAAENLDPVRLHKELQAFTQSKRDSPEVSIFEATYRGLLAALAVKHHWEELKHEERDICCRVLCDSIIETSQDWSATSRELLFPDAVNRVAAELLPKILSNGVEPTLRALVEDCLALAVTHPVLEVRDNLYQAIDLHLWNTHPDLAAKCVDAVLIEHSVSGSGSDETDPSEEDKRAAKFVYESFPNLSGQIGSDTLQMVRLAPAVVLKRIASLCSVMGPSELVEEVQKLLPPDPNN